MSWCDSYERGPSLADGISGLDSLVKGGCLKPFPFFLRAFYLSEFAHETVGLAVVIEPIAERLAAQVPTFACDLPCSARSDG